MSLPNIVGISGHIGCGKSAFAGYLNEKYPEYGRESVGDAVKEECARLFGFPLEWCSSEINKKAVIEVALPIFGKKYMTVREALQWWGTDIVRNMVSENHWVERVTGKGMVIIDDIRFPNECDYVKQNDGVLIRIEDYPGKPVDPRAYHISETALDDYPHFDLVMYPPYGQLKQFADNLCLDSLVGKGEGTVYEKLG